MRRFPHRGFQLIGALALLFVLTAGPVGAGIGICRTDPVIEVDGKRAHIYVSSLETILTKVIGPTEVVITVPNGVRTELISTDNGFGLGWNVRFKDSGDLRVTDRGIEVHVSVSVPATATLPVETEMTDRNDMQLAQNRGMTNEAIKFRAWL